LRALWALKDRWSLMAGAAGPLFAWQLVSHKLLRYLSPIPLAMAALFSVALAPTSSAYLLVFAGQVAFWLLVCAGSRGVEARAARFAYYFVLVNVASLVALTRFLRGQKQVLWQPRVG
jgi:hypothetical protein